MFYKNNSYGLVPTLKKEHILLHITLGLLCLLYPD